MNEELDFGQALRAMKLDGGRVALPHWGEDVYLEMQFPDENSKMTAPYIYVTSRYGKVPWVCTQIEMMSDKWILVK